MFALFRKHTAPTALDPARQGSGLGAGDRFESGEEHYSDELDSFNRVTPGWDEPMRVRGAIRRLRLDMSESGVRAAELIYGRKTIELALSQLRGGNSDSNRATA